MKIETTIRHACNAIGLVIDGVMRHIESDRGPDEIDNPTMPDAVTLFDAIDNELDGWDIPCDASNRRHLCDDMERLLNSGNPDPDLMEIFGHHSPETVHDIVAALLSRHALLP